MTPKEQINKEDYWLCKCGSYHKGFPYKCPLKEQAKEILNIVEKKINENLLNIGK